MPGEVNNKGFPVPIRVEAHPPVYHPTYPPVPPEETNWIIPA